MYVLLIKCDQIECKSESSHSELNELKLYLYLIYHHTVTVAKKNSYKFLKYNSSFMLLLTTSDIILICQKMGV